MEIEISNESTVVQMTNRTLPDKEVSFCAARLVTGSNGGGHRSGNSGMAGGRRRILVIEDDRETAQQIVGSLATSGYQVDLAVGGDDDLRCAGCGDRGSMTIGR